MPKRGRRAKKRERDNGIKSLDGLVSCNKCSESVYIGDNFDRWLFTRNTLNIRTDEEFVNYLLNLAEIELKSSSENLDTKIEKRAEVEYRTSDENVQNEIETHKEKKINCSNVLEIDSNIVVEEYIKPELAASQYRAVRIDSSEEEKDYVKEGGRILEQERDGETDADDEKENVERIPGVGSQEEDHEDDRGIRDDGVSTPSTKASFKRNNRLEASESTVVDAHSSESACEIAMAVSSDFDGGMSVLKESEQNSGYSKMRKQHKSRRRGHSGSSDDLERRLAGKRPRKRNRPGTGDKEVKGGKHRDKNTIDSRRHFENKETALAPGETSNSSVISRNRMDEEQQQQKEFYSDEYNNNNSCTNNNSGRLNSCDSDIYASKLCANNVDNVEGSGQQHGRVAITIKLCSECDSRHLQNRCPLRNPERIVEDSVSLNYYLGNSGTDIESVGRFKDDNEDIDDDDPAGLNDCEGVSTLTAKRSVARISMPNCLRLKSIDPDHGPSVVTVRPIPPFTRFGPVVGQPIKEMEIPDDFPMKDIWEIDDNGKCAYISTEDPDRSNWLRWLRPSPTREERNMAPVQEGAQLYFVTTCALLEGDELLYWADGLLSSKHQAAWSGKKMSKTNCGGCNLRFAHPLYYRRHCAVFHDPKLSLTIRKYHCKVCGESVLGKENIMKHAADNHDGKGAYQCQYCKKFFLRLNYLEMHRTYGCASNPRRTRPLCDYCGRKFCQPQKLKIHIKRMHSEISEVLREFQCKRCLKVLGSRAALQRHTKEVHHKAVTGSCTCERCGKMFQNKSNLKIHMLTHSGIKPFRCQQNGCQAAFTTKQCLQFHYKKVHGYADNVMPRIERSVAYTFDAYAGEARPGSANSSSCSSGTAGHYFRDTGNTPEGATVAPAAIVSPMRRDADDQQHGSDMSHPPMGETRRGDRRHTEGDEDEEEISAERSDEMKWATEEAPENFTVSSPIDDCVQLKPHGDAVYSFSNGGEEEEDVEEDDEDDDQVDDDEDGEGVDDRHQEQILLRKDEDHPMVPLSMSGAIIPKPPESSNASLLVEAALDAAERDIELSSFMVNGGGNPPALYHPHSNAIHHHLNLLHTNLNGAQHHRSSPTRELSPKSPNYILPTVHHQDLNSPPPSAQIYKESVSSAGYPPPPSLSPLSHQRTSHMDTHYPPLGGLHGLMFPLDRVPPLPPHFEVPVPPQIESSSPSSSTSSISSFRIVLPPEDLRYDRSARRLDDYPDEDGAVAENLSIAKSTLQLDLSTTTVSYKYDPNDDRTDGFEPEGTTDSRSNIYHRSTTFVPSRYPSSLYDPQRSSYSAAAHHSEDHILRVVNLSHSVDLSLPRSWHHPISPPLQSPPPPFSYQNYPPSSPPPLLSAPYLSSGGTERASSCRSPTAPLTAHHHFSSY